MRIVPWPDGAQTTVEPLEDGTVRVIFTSADGERMTDNTYGYQAGLAQARGQSMLATAMNWAIVQAQEAKGWDGSNGDLH